MIKKIAITGPESSGKSELSKKLAELFSTVYVPEYSREYLENLNRTYVFDDLTVIAQGQIKSEKQLIKIANRLLICDTELTVIKIWSEVKFGKFDSQLIKMYKEQYYDLYLLCKPDIPWQPDPLRENPENRDELFEMYCKELNAQSRPFKIISGNQEKRILSAFDIINRFLNDSNYY